MSGYLSARLIVALVRWWRRGRAGCSHISACLAYMQLQIRYPICSFWKKRVGCWVSNLQSSRPSEIAARSNAFPTPFSQTMAELELIQCLSSILSSDTNTRIAAELRLGELLKSPDAGLALSRTITTHELEMTLRQMSIRPSSSTPSVT